MMKEIATLLCLLLVGCTSSRPAAVALPTQHTVQRGEVLSQITRRYYGDGNESRGIKAILTDNPERRTAQSGPGIPPGPIVLTIPELTDD